MTCDRLCCHLAAMPTRQRVAWNILLLVQRRGINALSEWLEAQTDGLGSPELRRLHSAVAVLAHPNPRQEDVRPLCSAWGVVQIEQQKRRPLATLIAELRQAVLAEGTRLRARCLAAQRGVSASSAPPLAKPNFVQRPRAALNSLHPSMLFRAGSSDQCNLLVVSAV